MGAGYQNGSPPPTKEDVAQAVARSHWEVDPSISLIYRLEAPGRESDPSEPVKLLEVTPNTTVSGILPVYFGPHAPSGVIYPCVIVEIHPSEWDQLQSGRLPLPNGWRLGSPLSRAAS